jgi:O-antigen biosynthesis protein
MGPALEARDRFGTTVLYEVDDNLLRVHPESHAYKVFRPGSEPIRLFEQWVRQSDGLIVTTPDLAGQLSHLNPRVFVIQNHIDFDIRDWNTPVPRDPRTVGKTVIGWAGGSTHQADDAPVREVLEGILRDYDDVVLALCSNPILMDDMGAPQKKAYSGVQDGKIWRVEKQVGALNVPPEKVIFLKPVEFQEYQEYPVIPAQFDIGIAPLRDTEFNRNKSWLKIMEYGARGVPYVASDIAPYRRFQIETNGVGGFLAEGKSDWDVALRHLIEHPAARAKRGEDFERLIREQYGLAGNIWRWEEVLTQAQDKSAVRTWESTEKPGRNAPCPCGSGKKTKRCCGKAFG